MEPPTQDTIAESPQARRARPATDVSATASWGAASDPVAALAREEAERVHTFSGLVLVLAVIGSVMALFQATPRWLTVLILCSIAYLVAIALWVRWRFARGRYDRFVYRVFAGSAAVLSGVLSYYGGMFSTAPAVLTMGIVVFGMADDVGFASLVGFGAVGLYAAMSLLVMVGVLPEHGLFHATGATMAAKGFALGMTASVMMAALLFARAARKATRDAVGRLSVAIRQVQQRDALLGEVQRDLDVALKVDAGKRGPYTGATANGWQIGEMIGRGAMGDVYAAAREPGGERAAIKVLAAAARETPRFLERFEREARVTARLADAHIARVLDVGRLDDGTPFYAMELLAGHDLAWHLRRRPAMAVDTVVALAAQVAAGLDAAHRAGVVHRDIKPQNLFLADGTGGKRWKVLDFGVARELDSHGTLTQGAIIGSPGYMSPEQAQGKEADARSDVFSLGAVLYRVLTGRPPFSAPDTPALLYEIVYREPAQPSELAPVLGEAIDAVLALAMAKRAEDRFAEAGQLAQALAAAARGTLDAELLARARRLQAARPWGSTQAPR